jgi:hypothetical protein
VIALLAVALILLPLYLWPLRLGLGGLSSVAALLGIAGDPRDPAAVARIPQDAWEVLMGGADAPPSPSGGATTTPPNLTMIADLKEITGGALDAGPAPLLGEDSALAQDLIAAAGGGGGVAAGVDTPGEASGSPASSLLASYPGGGSGDGGYGGSNWSQFGGGYRDFGPWSGGGGPLLLTSGPGSDPVAPTPTPEPATLLLIGSNAALLGAAALKRRRSRRGSTPIG